MVSASLTRGDSAPTFEPARPPAARSVECTVSASPVPEVVAQRGYA